MNAGNPEKRRLAAPAEKKWKYWGPYLSERQWGTVREDYSPGGTAWDYFPHEAARSRAYRWGEDGIAGVSDQEQRLCLALAMWNGVDPILKERLFGLNNAEGNHGEDVKEVYYYLDATPTHSYLKMLYKYPQRAFPYELLVEENRRRGKAEREYRICGSETGGRGVTGWKSRKSGGRTRGGSLCATRRWGLTIFTAKGRRAGFSRRTRRTASGCSILSRSVIS